MFTGFSKTGEILNDSQKIRRIFQRVQNPILTQIKASLQVSYDLDQANTVTYEFISNSLVSEVSSIGDHNPWGFADVKNCCEKASEIGVKGAGGAIFTGFYPNWYSYRTERNNISLTRGSNSISRVEGSASPSKRKTEQGCIHQVQKRKRLRIFNKRSHLWKPSVRNLKWKKWMQVRKNIKTRTMRATILVDTKAKSRKRGLSDSSDVSCYIR